MFKKVDKNAERLVRHLRVRKKISGSEQRPRLSVYRSSKHIYAQIINDVAGHTLVAASTVEADVKALCEGKTKTEQAQIVGKVIGGAVLLPRGSIRSSSTAAVTFTPAVSPRLHPALVRPD